MVMKDSKYTSIKVNIYLPMLLTILNAGTNTSLQIFLLLYFGSCVNTSALFLPRSFPFPSAQMDLMDLIPWELLHDLTGCDVSALIPSSYFLLYLHYYSLVQFNN